MNRDRRIKSVEDFFKSVEIHNMTGLVTCPCGMLRTRDGRLPKIEIAYSPLFGTFDFGDRKIIDLSQLTPRALTELRHSFEADLERASYEKKYPQSPNAFNLSNPCLTSSSADNRIIRINYVFSLYKIS